MSGNSQKKKVVVFGIFDGVHDGRRDLFSQAKALGDEVIVIVGRDETAEKLKGKKPKYSEDERIKMLRAEPLVDDALLGDTELSTYTVLVRCNPDVVCLGYDQDELEGDLRQWLVLRPLDSTRGKQIELRRAKPYKADALHSSLLTD